MLIKKFSLIIFVLFLSACAANQKEEIESIVDRDVWHTFPATMGGDRVWITYNHGYSIISENDPRKSALLIRVKFHNPTEEGMPRDEEFSNLSELDELLEKKITEIGGIYVGRITLRGYRIYYYYLDETREKVRDIFKKDSKIAGYSLQLSYKSDIKNELYWNELYPTTDDWQVIRDLKVLTALLEKGNVPDKTREVIHWAYFSDQENARLYSEWVTKQKYTIQYNGKDLKSSEYLVKYSHDSTMRIEDITHHTIASNRKARQLKGRYDGWETSVER